MASAKFCRLLLLLSVICMQGLAQSGTDSKKQSANDRIKALIESKKFSFHPTSATSQKGRAVQLTSEYYIKLNNDTLRVDLPYYGRAYTTDYGSTDQSIRFKTNQFTYTSDSAKKGGWDITIVPKNQSKASKIYMSVSAGGYCTTQVMSNSRTTVSFYGNIAAYDNR
jgi:hypothetical protein